MRRLHGGIGCLVIAWAMAMLALPAAAHAVLESSDPAAGASIERAPAAVTLTFDEPVETSLGSLRVLDASGAVRSLGPVVHPAGQGQRISVRVGPLARGRYVVAWRVVSQDSHIVGGAFAFGLGVPAGDAPSLASDPTSAILLPVVHAAILAGVLLAVGLPIGAVALGAASGAATFVEFAAWIVLATAAFADIALRAELAGGELGASFATHTGELRSITIVAAFLGLAALFGRTRRWALLLPAGVVAVLSLSAAGHAPDGPLPAVGVLADALHLAGAATWIGVLGMALTLRPTDLLRRISPVATIAVATIVVTGIVQTVRNVGALAPLVRTPYGWAIDAKIMLLIGALVVAWSARRSFARGAFGIRRRLAAELGVLAAVVAVTAVLVDLPLPRDVAPRAVVTTMTVRDIDVRITASEQDARHWAVLVAGAGPDGKPRALDGVDVSLSDAHARVGPFAVPMTRRAAGAFAGALMLPFAGDWSIFVSARSGDFDENHTTIPLSEGKT